jgi:thiamine pyrophosphate-dependent acetolactate synthase large subunit-like protein
MIKGSELFVAALANEGVDRVFGVVGAVALCGAHKEHRPQ